MHAQSKLIVGNLIQQQFMAGQNFDSILNVLEDVIVGAVMTAVTSPHSNMAGNTPKDVLREFFVRVAGKISDLGPLNVEEIVRAAIRAQEHEREMRARAEEDGR